MSLDLLLFLDVLCIITPTQSLLFDIKYICILSIHHNYWWPVYYLDSYLILRDIGYDSVEEWFKNSNVPLYNCQ